MKCGHCKSVNVTREHVWACSPASGAHVAPVRTWQENKAVAVAKVLGSSPVVVAEEVTAGIYELDGEIFKVQKSRTSGKLYALVLTDTHGATRLTEAGTEIEATYQYAPGAFRRLRPAHRINTERAEALSIKFTFCIVCGRHLKAAASVARGIGPVCAGKV